MQRSKLPYLFLGLAAVISAMAVVTLITRLRESQAAVPAPQPPPAAISQPPPPPAGETTQPIPPENPQPEPPAAVAGVTAADPAELADRIAKALEAGDFKTVEKFLGTDALDPETKARLDALAGGALRIRRPDGVREVGELELNVRTRWALELEAREAGQDRILLDLRRDKGRWTVEKILFPPAPGEAAPKAAFADSLGVADAFIQAVLKQDFEFARAFVDPATVSDAKIAGLCILFEEGNYRLRKSKPLRSLYNRGDSVGYLINVESADGSQAGQFALALKQPPAPSNWIVSEINLDQLLADYSKRVAGGDVYYSPLVKNPSGGDTLALYFQFDQDDMDPRTRRQLEIVTLILKSDPGKKITLSGHTDSRGTKDYNDSLSSRRADTVRDYLIKAGVDARQINTVAKGDSQPRRPNVTEAGQDNPEGRRANRRTEIYLDF